MRWWQQRMTAAARWRCMHQSDEGMRRAALAGVDTIEHGFNGTEATFRLMAEKHVAYMPTLTATEAYGSTSIITCPATARRRKRCRMRRMLLRWHARRE